MKDSHKQYVVERRIAEVRFVLDGDVEVSRCLSDGPRHEGQAVRPNHVPSTGKSQSTRRSAKKAKGAKEEEHDEFEELVGEELPEEFTDNASRPTALLGDEETSHTNFGFQTPKKRHGMVLKAQQSASKYTTPVRGDENKTPHKTPRRKDVNEQVKLNTPRRVSFIGEMGATPSKRIVAENTPTKSVLKRKENVMSDIAEVHHTPRARRSLASHCVVTPKGKEKEMCLPKTPRSMRSHTRAMIQKAVAHDTSGLDSEDDFSADDDMYEPSDEGEESSDDNSRESSEDEGSEEEEEHYEENKRVDRSYVAPVSTSRSTAKKLKNEQMEYEFTSDSYFETQSTKGVTSNNTLSRLRTPRLQQDRLGELLADVDAEHRHPITELTNEYRALEQRWLFTLKEGYSILLYGLGSKRHLLQSLYQGVLSDCRTLIVNGFFPGLTIKEVVDSILSELMGVQDVPTNVLECVDLIESMQSSRRAEALYLLVHNLDGPALRSDRAQTVLSRLARAPNTYLIASVDHINAPLLWDQAKLRRYNFVWWDVTSFVAYVAETSFESSLLIQQSGALALSSLHSVFKSLTPNAKAIFMIIAKHVLENKSNINYTGMPFRDLYWQCREAFLVSSDGALRAQLTEFLDHHLIKSRRSSDATETLHIPIECGVLSQFIESQELDG